MASSMLEESVSCPPARSKAPSSTRWGPRLSSGWSHIGWRLRTVGMDSKLYSGGGELIDHSKVSAPQGSGPAGSPVLWLLYQLTKIIRMPAASTKAPMVDTRFQTSHPSPP